MSMKRLPVCNNFNGMGGNICVTIGCYHTEYKHYMTDEELALYGLKRMGNAI